MTSTCAKGMFVVTQQWAGCMLDRFSACAAIRWQEKGISIVSPRSSCSILLSTNPHHYQANTPHKKNYISSTMAGEQHQPTSKRPSYYLYIPPWLLTLRRGQRQEAGWNPRWSRERGQGEFDLLFFRRGKYTDFVKGGAKPVGDDGKAEFNGGDPVELGKQGGSKSS